MTQRSRRKPFTVAIPPRLRHPLAIVAVLVLAVGAVYFYDYMSTNLWLDRDAGRLEGYPIHLIEQQREVPTGSSGQYAQVDRLLIEEMRRDRRNVVTVSRSEVRFNLLRTRAYVKVFLETALPGQPERRSRLRVICVLRRGSAGWQLAESIEKTIE